MGNFWAVVEVSSNGKQCREEPARGAEKCPNNRGKQEYFDNSSTPQEKSGGTGEWAGCLSGLHSDVNVKCGESFRSIENRMHVRTEDIGTHANTQT